MNTNNTNNIINESKIIKKDINWNEDILNILHKYVKESFQEMYKPFTYYNDFTVVQHM